MRDGPRDTREGVRRREGRGGGGGGGGGGASSGGRDSSERTAGITRRNRREVGDRDKAAAAQSADRESADKNKTTNAETPRSEKGLCVYIVLLSDTVITEIQNISHYNYCLS